MKYANTTIDLNEHRIATWSLETFLKSNLRGQFVHAYKEPDGTVDQSKIDAKMQDAWNQCKALCPQKAADGDASPKGPERVQFTVNQKFLDANKKSKAKVGDVITLTAAEAATYQ